MGLEGGINLFSYVDNNPIVIIDPWGLQVVVTTGGATGPFPAGHPVFQPGSKENRLLANDLSSLFKLMDPRPVLRDIKNLFKDNDTNVCLTMGKGQGDKYGPLWDAPGNPGWSNPQNKEPHDPDWWDKPSNWDKMTKWQRVKWLIKKAAGAATGAGGVGI